MTHAAQSQSLPKPTGALSKSPPELSNEAMKNAAKKNPPPPSGQPPQTYPKPTIISQKKPTDPKNQKSKDKYKGRPENDIKPAGTEGLIKRESHPIRTPVWKREDLTSPHVIVNRSASLLKIPS
ncbi:hypothetical protein PTTG_29263 [Puccinia triticina 1-1 BBBD Race 1]|uniref:Uncharacterized protein n=2 Tax=Puccinia triticina TaxID=208348 RepID=A0A180G576_PUCT1|nr:uncharacterized protein PtA15_15A177 [Puccinia triticina]XP_053027347.1 uncharacterized protein PtA15_15A184 [Puccinia triticina]OAV87845.1 hypothetical protein PTTG_29263 [Puccinia triticina 1-1 BBBD Race 1]WAQ91785.1 hypothetical protein PtA15_15A177 [Puccinia triticina]WAQ91792.1 hypothetical protein PtA15_15A184 [Puccinia triticina]WAR62587.1 hypothetical protein PtB15_15B173 [Puccinia triticina]WAR62591.1 hypothetical protein PtB15_15B177 [Puccinia triticina]